VEGVPTPAPEPETLPDRVLQRGDLLVDFARHRIMLGGDVVRLSPTEFDVLAYLVREAPRVVSPEEVAYEVQGYEEPWEAAETVRVHRAARRHPHGARGRVHDRRQRTVTAWLHRAATSGFERPGGVR
jgi:DNA-binding response OmpR family regulator